MSQSQDKNRGEIANSEETPNGAESIEILDLQDIGNKGKWYQNNWFILTVSVVMIALLVFSVFLSNQWNKIERTIFGNKAFYYKMEMENFFDITERFSSSIEYSYEEKTATKGSMMLKSGERGLQVDICCDNDDDAELTHFGMELFKESAKGNALERTSRASAEHEDTSNESVATAAPDTNREQNENKVLPIAEIEAVAYNDGLWVEFPSSGSATRLYKVGNNFSRKIFKSDWLNVINNSDVGWAVFDMLQAVNNVVPDENVFHYDEAEFDERLVHKIEFVLDEQIQQNMKKALLDCYKKKEIKQVINKVESDLWEQFDMNDEVSANHKKIGDNKKSNFSNKSEKSRRIYKTIKTYLENIPCNNGTITYAVLYDDDQNILSRELQLSDNRIQVLSYTKNGELMLTFFNEKLGLNIENKCRFNNGSQREVDGRLIIDSGSDELGVVYKFNAVIGGIFPVGEVEVLSGRTGVAETNGGAISVWKANYNLSKVDKNVSFNFVLEKHQKNLFTIDGEFVVDGMKGKIIGKTSDEREKAKPITELSWQNLLSETVWNYILSK